MIIPELFEKAFDTSRSVPGMGSLEILFDPYNCDWMAVIGFTNEAKFFGVDKDINIALERVIEVFENNKEKYLKSIIDEG